jgi:hypothetical protein
LKIRGRRGKVKKGRLGEEKGEIRKSVIVSNAFILFYVFNFL